MSDKIDSLTFPIESQSGQTTTVTYDIDLPPDNRISLYAPYYCTASGTAAVTTAGSETCAKWTINNADIKALYSGLTVVFTVPVLGDNGLGTGVKMNTDTVFHPVVYNTNSAVGDRYAIGSLITLVYNATATGIVYINGSKQTVTGCWQVQFVDDAPQIVRYI